MFRVGSGQLGASSSIWIDKTFAEFAIQSSDRVERTGLAALLLHQDPPSRDGSLARVGMLWGGHRDLPGQGDESRRCGGMTILMFFGGRRPGWAGKLDHLRHSRRSRRQMEHLSLRLVKRLIE